MKKQMKGKKGVRRDVYAVLREVMGRDLTISEHETVRNSINEYLEEHQMHCENINTPKTHHLICRECAAKKTIVGRKAITNAYKGRRRGFVAE